ncbi:MAG: PEP-CTERM/exosortase system-associated acyltransferase [Acidobacteria bacterium]|nr:PEP-CTERM/exosortase system-associated acyltransferase [Acidobacteriota bacterium]
MEALSALYDRYFMVKPASTPALLDAAYALRYQVYCIEHAFEAPVNQMGERETDRYDAHSVHAVLWHRQTDKVVGCVRLILPTAQEGLSALPIRSLLGPAERHRMDALPPATTAEISRYAVSKSFRRRTGEELYPDVTSDLSSDDARRLAPHMTLGLFRGVATLATANGVTHLCAAMAPALLRLLERFGLSFERLGAPIEHHGLRQPCIAELADLGRGLARARSEYYHFADPTFHPTGADG